MLERVLRDPLTSSTTVAWAWGALTAAARMSKRIVNFCIDQSLGRCTREPALGEEHSGRSVSNDYSIVILAERKANRAPIAGVFGANSLARSKLLAGVAGQQASQQTICRYRM